MMAKSSKTAAPPATVTVTYDLFDLPTAQHKAGLAGLLLQIGHMKGRIPKPPTPSIIVQTATSATIEFTADTMQSLMDNLYDAEMVRVKVRSKWSNAKLLSEEYVEERDKDGKKKKIKLFTYEVCQPQGHFLRQHLPATEGDKGWHKLWRDMLWAIPRGNPQSRQPFEQRAESPKKPCKEGAAAWQDLLRVQKARKTNGFYTNQVAGSLWLGAQAVNAENVPFEGRAEQTLLLHFWPLTALVYVPDVVHADGESEFVGYVLAIPEVADLAAFVEQFPKMLVGLGKDSNRFRPAEAVIDLPAQGALSFLEHLARLSADKTAAMEISTAIASVEFMHLVKVGNNIKSVAAGRLAPRPHLLERYLGIIGRPGEKPPFGNPLFRRGLMLALLRDLPWFEPFGEMFAEWPHKFFVPSGDTPRFSWFWVDARRKFTEVMQDMATEPTQSQDPNDRLATLVYRLVRTYLGAKAQEKSGINPEQFKSGDKIDWEKVPQRYKDDRRQIAESLFLEYRSRRERAFVDYFVARLGAVKQFISEDDYLAVYHALMNSTDDVKTLTLFALSANS